MKTNLNFEVRTRNVPSTNPSKDIIGLHLNGVLLAGTIDKSEEFYEGYISGFKRAVAMCESKSSLLYEASNDKNGGIQCNLMINP